MKVKCSLNENKDYQAYTYSDRLRWQSKHVASQGQDHTVLGDYEFPQCQSLSPTKAKWLAGAINQDVDKSSIKPPLWQEEIYYNNPTNQIKDIKLVITRESSHASSVKSEDF